MYPIIIIYFSLLLSPVGQRKRVYFSVIENFVLFFSLMPQACRAKKTLKT